MKKIIFSLVFILGCHNLYGQSWVEVPQIQLNTYSHCLYTDTIDNLLYFGGMFGLNGSDTVRGVATWDNSTVSGCAEGLMNFTGGSTCNIPLTEIVRFQDKIYVGGGVTDFTVGDSIWTTGIGVWDGVAWDSIHVSLLNEYGYTASVTEMKVIGNTLYVAGGFTAINGTTVNGLAKYDGNNWASVHNFPNWGSSNLVRHIEEYNGEIYVAGVLLDSYPYDTMYNICRYNGTEWEQLGEGIGGAFSEILGMEVFQGKLYVCGSFNKNDRPLNPGNRIAAWNGSYWEQVVDIQGDNPSSYAYVKDMAVLNDELYVVGRFENVNGNPANNFAKFDGVNWCTYPDVFDAFIDQVEAYDGEIYITGFFTEISGAPISLYAKFDSNATPAECHSVVNIKELSLENFKIFPNPTNGKINISLNASIEPTRIELLNLKGQILSSIPFTKQVSFNQEPGMYLIRISDDNGQLGIRRIILK